MREHICGRNNGRVQRKIRCRILVVDDDAQLAHMLGALLAGEGHSVQVATHSLRVFDAAKDFGPDLILMDIAMPYLDGFDQIKLLSLDLRLATVPVILITAGRELPDAADDLDRLPIADCIYKPFDHADLLARIAAAPLRQGRPATRVTTASRSSILNGARSDAPPLTSSPRFAGF